MHKKPRNKSRNIFSVSVREYHFVCERPDQTDGRREYQEFPLFWFSEEVCVQVRKAERETLG